MARRTLLVGIDCGVETCDGCRFLNRNPASGMGTDPRCWALEDENGSSKKLKPVPPDGTKRYAYRDGECVEKAAEGPLRCSGPHEECDFIGCGCGCHDIWGVLDDFMANEVEIALKKEREPRDTADDPDWEPRATMVRVGGKVWRCPDCNSNVQTEYKPGRYKCNGCGGLWIGE